jgi:hypothetical protein
MGFGVVCSPGVMTASVGPHWGTFGLNAPPLPRRGSTVTSTPPAAKRWRIRYVPGARTRVPIRPRNRSRFTPAWARTWSAPRRAHDGPGPSTTNVTARRRDARKVSTTPPGRPRAGTLNCLRDVVSAPIPAARRLPTLRAVDASAPLHDPANCSPPDCTPADWLVPPAADPPACAGAPLEPKPDDDGGGPEAGPGESEPE